MEELSTGEATAPAGSPTTTTTTPTGEQADIPTRRSSKGVERRKRASSSSGVRRRKSGTGASTTATDSSGNSRRSKEIALGDGSSTSAGTATVATSSTNSGEVNTSNGKAASASTKVIRKRNSERNFGQKEAFGRKNLDESTGNDQMIKMSNAKVLCSGEFGTATAAISSANDEILNTENGKNGSASGKMMKKASSERVFGQKGAPQETMTNASFKEMRRASRRRSQSMGKIDQEKTPRRSPSPKKSLSKIADATVENVAQHILDSSAANSSAAGSSASAGDRDRRKSKKKSSSGTVGSSKADGKPRSSSRKLTDASSTRKRSSSRHKLANQSERTGSTRRVTQSTKNSNMVDASERFSTKHVNDRRRQLMVGKASSERMDSSSAGARNMSQSTQQHNHQRRSCSTRPLKSTDRAFSTTSLLATAKQSKVSKRMVDRSKSRSSRSGKNRHNSSDGNETMPSLTPQSSMEGIDIKKRSQGSNFHKKEPEALGTPSVIADRESKDVTSEIHSDPTTDGDGGIDAKGFPALNVTAPDSADTPSNPQHFLPDFPVGNFSFGDLKFPFDSKADLAFDGNDKKSRINKDTNNVKMDGKTSEKLPSTDDVTEADQKDTNNNETKHVTPATSTNLTNESDLGASTKWVCASCQEHHDEAHLDFCGMCGTKRPNLISPKAVKGTRKSTSGKRSNSKARPRGSHRSPTPGGDSEKEPSSTGSFRQVRSKDVTRTPRSRSKGNLISQSSDKIPPADLMVVKCLDDDNENAKTLDIDALNAKFNTFEDSEPLKLPSRVKKKSIRRSQSDVTHESAKVDTADPSTPRSRRKKGIQRSTTIHVTAPSTPRKMSHLPNPKNRPSVRKAIPRRTKSSTTEYLRQLKKEASEDVDDKSVHSGKLTLQSRSAHSTSKPTPSGPATPSSGRPSLMKAASSRLLGGLGTVVNATGLSSAAGMFSRSKGGVQLNDSEDDEDEFANDSEVETKQKAESPRDPASMLRDFPAVDLTKSPGRRPRGSSCEPLQTSRRPSDSHNHDIQDSDAMRTPRHRRASLDARATPGADEPKGTGGESMWNKWTKSPKKSSSRDGAMHMDEDEDDDEADNHYYDDIDIDEDEDVEVYGEDTPDPTVTPRRIRQRMPRRPMARRDQQGGGKQEHATPGKYMTPRQRLRRASVTAESMKAPIPMLDVNEDEKKPPPITVAEGLGVRRGRRASLGHVQETPSSEEIPASASSHGITQGRPGARAARSRRRGSVQISNPLLQLTLSHMSQDPTHAVRGDLKDEWKKQEELEDMRKKATKMQKRFQGAAMMNTNSNPGEAIFEADFPTENEAQQERAVGEDGADLEVPKDQEDVSDISSNDGLE